MLVVAGCGSDDGGSTDLANGKTFDGEAVTSCLRQEGYAVNPRQTDIGVEYAVRWRTGRNNADIAVEDDPDAAASREEEWKGLAADAGVENIDSYYFRYGNILIGFEQAPGQADRAKFERCLR